MRQMDTMKEKSDVVVSLAESIEHHRWCPRRGGPSVLDRPADDAVGGIAQLGERLPCTQNVAGSIPVTSTRT